MQGTDKLIVILQQFASRLNTKVYKHHRFPPETIRYTAWLYYRFNLKHQDGEVLDVFLQMRCDGDIKQVEEIPASREATRGANYGFRVII